MLDDIRIFVQVARSESLANAARFLNIPTATITRRLQKLEEELGSKLINRSARHFSLTAEGETYYAAYAEQIQKLEDTAQALKDQSQSLNGDLHVLAPTNISTGLLHPMWSEFVKAHPHIRLKLKVSNTLEDMLSENVDLALRIGPLPDSTLYQQRLGAVQTVLVASPGYLNNSDQPETIAELNQHRLLVSSNLSNWHLTHGETKESITFRPSASLEVNDIQIVRKFLLEDLGISLLPKSEVWDDLEKQRLIQVLPDWQGPSRSIYAVWPSGKLLNAKAKKLKEFMKDYIQTLPVLNEPN